MNKVEGGGHSEEPHVREEPHAFGWVAPCHALLASRTPARACSAADADSDVHAVVISLWWCHAECSLQSGVEDLS